METSIYRLLFNLLYIRVLSVSLSLCKYSTLN
nr:MAG TPA: hypothetical protein [Caudoviricetes sp.]